MSTQSATFPATAPASAGILLPAFTLWWREVVRFYRQRARVVGVIASPLLFWVVLGSGFGTSFRSGQGAGQQNYLDYFYPGVLVMIVLFTAIFTMMSVIEDRNEGFLLSVLVAPVPRAAIVLGKVLGGYLYPRYHARLHRSREPVAARSYHRPTQFMQPSPGSLVTSQPQNPLQPQGTHPVFLRGHPPHRPEPNRQRRAGVLEDRPRRHRDLPSQALAPATGSNALTKPCWPRTLDSGTPSANAIGTDTPGRPAPWKSAPPTPPPSEDSLPSAAILQIALT